jgi:O-acetyl-ADP-ribose deacetylase (regulator of RNase III)/NAD-dependent SIR2 family protein deacetylase
MVSTPVAARYEETVRSVAATLLRESGYSLHHLRTSDVSDLRSIIQHLLVIRPAPEDPTDTDTDEEILYQQVDEILALEQSRTALVDADTLPSVGECAGTGTEEAFKRIVLWKGDITVLRATAIVNAANSALLGCFQPPHRCIDNVIHCKAGPRLRTACAQVIHAQGHDERVGDAKITPGFSLPSEYVVHTVGPALRRGQKPTSIEREQLASCYTSSLDALLVSVQDRESQGSITIAFPCISTGLFAFPADEAVPIAVRSVVEWLEKHAHETASWRVIFNTFLPSDLELYTHYFQQQVQGFKLPPPAPDASLQKALRLVQDADYLLISAGAGLSAAAGLDYTSESVMQKFHPKIREIIPSFRMMYSSIGYSKWHPELMWGYLFKQISIVRFDWVRHRSAPTYSFLHTIRNAFEEKTAQSAYIVTSNADGMFEQEDFPKESTCLMQGEYGRIQCRKPCRQDSVWDARPFMEKALESFNEDTYEIEDPEGIPKCPHCGGTMFLLLRIDGSFLESALAEGKRAYRQWLKTTMQDVKQNGKKLVILEVGVGFNTPGVLRIPNEDLATEPGVSLVRVNSDHPELPFDTNGVGLGKDANEVLQFLAQEVAPVKP